MNGQRKLTLKCNKTLVMQKCTIPSFTKGKTYLTKNKYYPSEKINGNIIVHDDQNDEHALGDWHQYFTLIN